MKKLILFLTLFFVVPVFAQDGFVFSKQKKCFKIPFKLINNLVFIPVEVNGKTLTFLLDTGIKETILFSLSDVDELQLKGVEKIKLRGIGSQEPVDAYKSSGNNLKVKNFKDENHDLFLILDKEFNFSTHVGIPVNGIIGYYFFKNYPIRIDYDRKKITVYNQDFPIHRKIKSFHRDTLIVEESKPYVSIPVYYGETKMNSKLLMDTGNTESIWLFGFQKDSSMLPKKTIDDYLGRGLNGDINGKRGRLKKVVFGKYSFEKPLCSYPDSLSLKGVNFTNNRDGSIGSEIISRFTIFLDYKNGQYFTKQNKEIDRPFNFNMSGIEIVHAGLQRVGEIYQKQQYALKVYTDTNTSNTYSNPGSNRKNNDIQVYFKLIPVFKIAKIRTGSSAESIGLKVGDRILKINNKAVDKFTIQEINEMLKSEDGKKINLDIERENKRLKFTLELKKIL